MTDQEEEALVEELRGMVKGLRKAVGVAIQEAVVAERERVLKLIEEHHTDAGPPGLSAGPWYLFSRIRSGEL